MRIFDDASGNRDCCSAVIDAPLAVADAGGTCSALGVFNHAAGYRDRPAADVAAALKTALEALDIPFVATVASAVVTLTAKEKGVAANDIAVTATTNDGTQTLTVANGTSGSDVVLNPGWFARSTAEAANDLLIVDLG